jgi:hypothetical protein
MTRLFASLAAMVVVMVFVPLTGGPVWAAVSLGYIAYLASYAAFGENR